MSEILLERALAGGDLRHLDESQRTELVVNLCGRLGLDINISPFGFYHDDVTGVVKVVIRKSGIEDLRRIHNVSITNMNVLLLGDVVVFTAHGETALRKEVSSGTMSLEGLAGPEKSKAFLFAETKAKHRLTLALVGLGIQEEPDLVAQLAKHYAEPVKAAEPQVNQEPAIEHADARHHGPFPPPTPEQVEAGKTLQAIIDRGHSFPEPEPEKMAAEMDKSAPTPQNEAVAKPIQKPAPVEDAGGFGGMFGGEPESITHASPATSWAIPEEPRDDRPTISEVPPFAEPAQVEQRVPEQVAQNGDLRPEPPAQIEEKLTPIEFKAFTARCTKLVRDVLPKCGKEAPGLLLPFLKKTFGTNDIQSASRSLWEATLTHIESAPNADKLAILKGQK